jgi:hypothetical protein
MMGKTTDKMTDNTKLKTMRNSTRDSAFNSVQKFTKCVAALLAVAMLAISAPVMAGPEDEPSAQEMFGDLVVARPVGLVITAVGAAAFVVSLPFSALGGNIGKAAEKLVIGPARETFVRCLGCENVGRYRKPKT